MEKNENEQGFTLPDTASANRAALISKKIVDIVKKDPVSRALWYSSEQAMDLAAELDNGSQKDRKDSRFYIPFVAASTIATVACAIAFPPLLIVSLPSLLLTSGFCISNIVDSQEKKEQSIACKAIAKMSPDEKKGKRSAALHKIISDSVEHLAVMSGITNDEGLLVSHIKFDNAQMQHQYNLDNKFKYWQVQQ